MKTKILVACEESATVREAFKRRGYDAWSCDLLPSAIPGQHIQDDVLKHLNDGWDLMIAHPPCTYISNMSNCRINEVGRKELRLDGMKFFMKIVDAPIKQIAIENPRGLPERQWRKPDQIIQPYQFGHPFSKATCLWLKNLPLLIPTKTVEYQRKWDGKRWRTWVDFTGSHNAKNRSKTFQGIADAMANQWGTIMDA